MVMDRFGTDLQKVFEENGKRFSRKTVLQLGLRLVSCMAQAVSEGHNSMNHHHVCPTFFPSGRTRRNLFAEPNNNRTATQFTFAYKNTSYTNPLIRMAKENNNVAPY